jgi:hypothetical protein
MGAQLSSSSPYFPYAGALFGLAFVGILVVLFSRNVLLKRRVLPASIALFSLCCLLVLSASGKLGASWPAHVGAAILLLANGLWVYKVIRFCPGCGKTYQASGTGGLCPGCGQPVDNVNQARS